MLPAYANTDGRLQTVRRGIVKLNAVEDEVVKSMNRSRIAKGTAGIFYKGDTLGGALSGEQYKCYECEPVGIFRARAGIADPQRFPTGKAGNRGARGQEIRVPVVYNCNGFKADHPWQIDQQVQMLGFADQTGRFSGKNHLNAIVGGLLTVVNSGPGPIEAGDIVMARAPTKAEAARIGARAGDIANKNGRVPFILVSMSAAKYDLMNPVRFDEVLRNFYTANGSDQAYFKDFKNAYCDMLYEQAVIQMVKSIAAFMANTPTPSDADCLAAVVRLQQANMKNVRFEFLMATVRLMTDLSSRCVGRATLSAESGHEFDLLVGRYMR